MAKNNTNKSLFAISRPIYFYELITL